MGEFLISLMIGGAVGLLVGLAMRRAISLGIVWNAAVGFLGALLGRVAYGLFRGDTDGITAPRLDSETVVVCIGGALLVLFVANRILRRRAA